MIYQHIQQLRVFGLAMYLIVAGVAGVSMNTLPVSAQNNE